jgi:anti-anti-sigma regulatory factor
MNPVVKVVQPSGILDGTKAGQFRQEISQLVEANVDIVLIDFQDSKLFICSVNEQIKMLFELTSMDRVFEIFPSREEFENAVLSTH